MVYYYQLPGDDVSEGRTAGASGFVRSYWAPMVLVLTSLAAAVAGLFDAKAWVAGGAALIAVLAGWRTVTSEILQPRRRDRLGSSVAVVLLGRGERGPDPVGDAFHLGSGEWLTADFVLEAWTRDKSVAVHLRHDGADRAVNDIVALAEPGFMLLRTEAGPQARVKLSSTTPGLHSPVAVAYEVEVHDPHRRLKSYLIEYRFVGTYTTTVVTKQSALPLLSFSGPELPSGIAGAPVLDVKSGAVCGMVYEKSSGASAASLHAAAIPASLSARRPAV